MYKLVDPDLGTGRRRRVRSYPPSRRSVPDTKHLQEQPGQGGRRPEWSKENEDVSLGFTVLEEVSEVGVEEPERVGFGNSQTSVVLDSDPRVLPEVRSCRGPSFGRTWWGYSSGPSEDSGPRSGPVLVPLPSSRPVPSLSHPRYDPYRYPTRLPFHLSTSSLEDVSTLPPHSELSRGSHDRQTG